MQGYFNLAVFTLKGLLRQSSFQYTIFAGVFLAAPRGPLWADGFPGARKHVSHLFAWWIYFFTLSLPLLHEIVNITQAYIGPGHQSVIN